MAGAERDHKRREDTQTVRSDIAQTSVKKRRSLTLPGRWHGQNNFHLGFGYQAVDERLPSLGPDTIQSGIV